GDHRVATRDAIACELARHEAEQLLRLAGSPAHVRARFPFERLAGAAERSIDAPTGRRRVVLVVCGSRRIAARSNRDRCIPQVADAHPALQSPTQCAPFGGGGGRETRGRTPRFRIRADKACAAFLFEQPGAQGDNRATDYRLQARARIPGIELERHVGCTCALMHRNPAVAVLDPAAEEGADRADLAAAGACDTPLPERPAGLNTDGAPS